MKTVEQLRRLQKNPYYKMTNEEKQLLDSDDAPREGIEKVSSKDENFLVDKGHTIAAVKETGKVKKHKTDPVQ